MIGSVNCGKCLLEKIRSGKRVVRRSEITWYATMHTNSKKESRQTVFLQFQLFIDILSIFSCVYFETMDGSIHDNTSFHRGCLVRCTPCYLKGGTMSRSEASF